MKSTDSFSEEMKNFFDAESGAYTSFTEVELEKGTYNVKSVIKKLLIEKIGRENIPVVNITREQDITFKICEKAKIYGQTNLNIPCKFSKKGKEEMTIYFNRNLIALMNAMAGDIWYIYFCKNSVEPVLGVLSQEKWYSLFDEGNNITNEELDEAAGCEIQYVNEVEMLQIEEIDAPERKKVQKTREEGHTVRSVSSEEAARREKNRKMKGIRGEEIAIEIEKRRLTKMGRADLISKITHVAKFKDGLGYDIISTDIDANGREEEIYIEVKATAGDANMPFHVTAREVEVSRKYKELYYIYRIFAMKEKENSVQYYRLNGAIDENYNLTAMDYIAYRNKV